MYMIFFYLWVQKRLEIVTGLDIGALFLEGGRRFEN
jgi:hypothetical protein